MLMFFVFAALALAWVGFIWLVKREQGWVGVTDYKRAMLAFVGRMVLITDVIATTLTPAFKSMTKAMVAFNASVDAWHRVGEPGEPEFENDWHNVDG